jgi:hypothetical protein
MAPGRLAATLILHRTATPTAPGRSIRAPSDSGPGLTTTTDLMEQQLEYRGFRIVISAEAGAMRDWSVQAIAPGGGELAAGSAAANGARGSFKAAVLAAQRAVDGLIDTNPPPDTSRGAPRN